MAGLIALAIFDAGFWLLAVEPAATRTADREAAVAALESLVLLNRLDRSSEFLIVESLGARPREDTGDLQISMRIDTFVREL